MITYQGRLDSSDQAVHAGRQEGECLQGSCVEARLGEHVAQMHSKQLQVGLVHAAEHCPPCNACVLLVQGLRPPVPAQFIASIHISYNILYIAWLLQAYYMAWDMVHGMGHGAWHGTCPQ
jgi:hypothetical protein